MQKTEAHRKKVVEKKSDLISSKVTVQSIKKDNTLNKQNSHNRLQIMVSEQQTIFKSTVYLKSEIQLLCNAYGAAFRKNDSKSKLSGKLVPLIRTCNAFSHPFIFNDKFHSSEQSASTANVPFQENACDYSIILYKIRSLYSNRIAFVGPPQKLKPAERHIRTRS